MKNNFHFNSADTTKIVHLLNRFTEHKNNGKITVFNTCAIDSISEVFAAICVNYDHIKSEFDKGVTVFHQFIKEMVQSDNSDSVHHIRNTLIRSIFDKEPDQKNVIINCKYSIGGMLGKLLGELSNIYSYISTSTCEECNISNKRSFQLLDIAPDCLSQENFPKCLYHLNIGCSRKPCACGKKREEISFSNIIMFDVQLFNGFIATSINLIPSKLNIRDQSFNFVGVIEIIEGTPDNHFVAHVKAEDHFWQKYDDLSRDITQSDTNKQLNVTILFYIREQ